ncbi:MAG: four helix bundle protein [Deltaproteobacteria bacterium]|nr:four helix bundle protein [Deltaproteobacteria bacterium]
MTTKSFEDLEIWKSARGLAKEVYRLTADPKFSKDYRFRDQLRDAVTSVMSNIAKGCERGGNQEFLQFLFTAKGACGEARSHLYVAFDQAYLPQKNCEELSQAFKRLSTMISNLIDYLKGSDAKGPQYNNSNRPNGASRPEVNRNGRTI